MATVATLTQLKKYFGDVDRAELSELGKAGRDELKELLGVLIDSDPEVAEICKLS